MENLNWFSVATGLIGGLALFLFGMEQMTGSLKRLAGSRLKEWLARLTKNRLSGLFVGAGVTAIIQSSSVTTVLVVGFISAGVMTLSQSVGIIMGANIGTTITAQVIAFKVTKAALILLACGFFVHFFSGKERLREAGGLVFGLGLVFFGMNLMSEATCPLRDYPPFIELMQQIRNPLTGIAIGALVTAAVQSSSATTGIVIVLASQGAISLEAGIALIFGSNIGTCVTALLAAIGKPGEGVQASVIHLLFNFGGVLLWLAFIPYLAALVRVLSPSAPDLEGSARLAAEVPRQIANAHTVFNLTNSLLFLPFAGAFAWLARKLVPAQAQPAKYQARYLDSLYLDTPESALDRVYLELTRQMKFTKEMVVKAARGALEADAGRIKEAIALEKAVDALQKAILAYLGKIAEKQLNERDRIRLQEAIAITNYVESLADSVEASLFPVIDAPAESLARMNPELKQNLHTIIDVLEEVMENTGEAVQNRDATLAAEIVARKSSFQNLLDETTKGLYDRIGGRSDNALERFRFEVDYIESLKRIYYYNKRIAKALRQ